MAQNTLNQWEKRNLEMNSLASYVCDYFQDYPVSMAAAGNALPVGTDTATNVVTTKSGRYYFTNIGTQTLVAPTGTTTGLLISQDLTNGDGNEMTLQNPNNSDARFLFTMGSEYPFYIEAQFTVADVSGIAELLVGFRKNAAVVPARATYTDYALVGLIGAKLEIATDLNNAGETLTDTTMTAADGAVVTFRVDVDSNRKATFSVANSSTATLGTPTVTAEYTFDTSDVIVPCVRLLHAATTPGTVVMNYFKCGYCTA